MATQIFVHRYVVGAEENSQIRLGETPDEEAFIVIEKVATGKFQIVNDNITEKGDWVTHQTALGFATWDSEVTDLDNGYSDQSQIWEISSKIQHGDVVFELLFDTTIAADSIEDIVQAVKHFSFRAFCAGDI